MPVSAPSTSTSAARCSPPRPLTEINGPVWELAPPASPNGQYLFFTLGGTIMEAELAPLIEPRRTKTAKAAANERDHRDDNRPQMNANQRE
jgi:hypothetical protein